MRYDLTKRHGPRHHQGDRPLRLPDGPGHELHGVGRQGHPDREEGAHLHDPCAVAVLTHPEKFLCKDLYGYVSTADGDPPGRPEPEKR